MARYCLLLIWLALPVCGCATFEASGALPAGPIKVAVLDFGDSSSYKAVRDYSLVGAAGAATPGVLVARAVRYTVARCPGQQVMDWLDMRRKVGQNTRLAAVNDVDALDLARKLGANAVVFGHVQKYEERWNLPFMGWATVGFTVKCLNVAGGNELWSARVEDSSMGAIEEDVAAQICARLKNYLCPAGRTR